MAKVDLKLSRQPDGFGFYYGTVDASTETLRVNVMPPVQHWRGDIRLPGYEPHATDWIIYVDGEEFARARCKEGLGAIIEQRLLPRRA